MESRLVKILKKEADVRRLDEGNISEYVQAKNAADAYTSLIVEPYENFLIKEGEASIIDEPGLKVALGERTSMQRLTAKEVLALLGSTLETMKMNCEQGMQMYGVRRFGNAIAADASYLRHIVDGWENLVLGQSISPYVSVTGKKARQISAENAPRLVTYGFRQIEESLDRSIMNLYIATKSQVKDINSKIIRPFEKAFKDNAGMDPEQTVFDLKTYGKLAVQVKSVPRREPRYQAALENVSAAISQAEGLRSSQADGMNTFYNTDLNEPRIYVSVDALLSHIDRQKSRCDTNYRQEIAVLHMPERAVVVSA